MSRLRIVVADQAEAVFYDTPFLPGHLRETSRVRDVAAHLHERDLASDRPGRTHAPMGKGSRHAFGPEPHLRKQEAERFARLIARMLDEARNKDEFDELILVAAAPFLGMMRRELSRLTADRVMHVIPKDLVHGPVSDLERHLEALAAELAEA